MKRNEIIYTDAETFTDPTEEQEEITAEKSAFATAGGENGKKRNTKKTATAIIALLIAAAVLITGYFIFLHEPETEAETDDFYLVSAIAKDALEECKATVSFGDEESVILGDEKTAILYKFVGYMAEDCPIKIKTGTGGAYVTLSANGKELSFEKDEFFKTFEDGTPYAFDGERIITDGILELYGQEKTELPLRALKGYDTDGDVVTSTGKPFMYPSITRSDVDSITIKNAKTSFKVYRSKEDNKSFFIEGAEGVELNGEAFSYLVVNATYTCAEGKISNPKSFDQYGLEGDGSTAKVTVKTLDGKAHVLIIGDKDASGYYYYARYEGKPYVYMLLCNDVDSTFAAGGEAFLNANLVYFISDTQEIYSIDKMSIYFRDLDSSLVIRLRRAMAASSNITLSNPDADVSTMLSDLKRMSGTYSDWTKDSQFIGMGSKDGEAIQLALSLNRTSEDGRYAIKLPLVRDEGKGAYLPTDITIRVSTDGSTFNKVDITGKETLATQKNGTYYQHTFAFESDKPVKYVRIDLEGYSSAKYMVTDEIRVISGEVDANPADAFIGLWMITSEEYIPEGRNYAYVNTTNYVEFLLSLCTLVGDEVVSFGVGDAELVEYGFGEWGVNEETGKEEAVLDPAMQIHYVYGAYTMDLLFTDPAEDGSRYVMSMITGEDENGKEIKFINPYIARLTLETAPWMSWDPLMFTSSSLLYMYIDDVQELKFTFDGQEYNFVLGKDENGIANSVTCNGEALDMDEFRKLYLAVINVSRTGEYDKEDGEQGSEMLKINVVSETKTDEIIFYRVTSSKAYYTVDGAGGYYTLTYEVSEVLDRLQSLLAGETIK